MKGRTLGEEKALAARRRHFLCYFWNVRQPSPLEGRERIIREQRARLLFAEPVDYCVVGRLQTKRPAPRVVRIACHEVDEALANPPPRGLLGAAAEAARQSASGHLDEAALAYPLFQALWPRTQNAVAFRVGYHRFQTRKLNFVHRLSP